jgi:hypothetical protein
MKGTIRSLAAALMVAGVAACSDSASPTGSSLVADEPSFSSHTSATLTFASTQSYDTQTPQTATGGTGGIDFTGSLTTGTPCYDVSASLNQRSGTITVTVTATSSGGACIQVITHNNYTGQVSGLAPGTYDFRVVHEAGHSRTTAFSGQVTVN